LPVDNVLRDFLTANGLSMPADFAWTDDPKTTRALVAALVSDPAGAVRDPVAAKLRAAIALGDSAGTPLTPSNMTWASGAHPTTRSLRWRRFAPTSPRSISARCSAVTAARPTSSSAAPASSC
jgi:hypothetical protein